jgi:PAS domain S-box-containing protein
MFNLFFLLDLISAIFNFSLGYYVLYKDFKGTANRVFFLLTLAATFWAASSAAFRFLGIPMEQSGLEMNLEKSPLLFAFNQVGWLGIAFLPSIFLHLSTIIISPKGFFKRKEFLVSIYLISFIFLLWTFWTEPRSPLIFYSLFTFFFISCLFLSFFLLIKNYLSLKSYKEKAKLRYFLIGFLIPGIIGTALDVIFPLLRYKQFVGTTFSLYLFSLGYFFVAISVLKHGLFIDYREVLEKIFKGLTEMVVVTDLQGIILMTNEKTLEKLKYKEKEFIGKKIEDFIEFGNQKFNEISKKLKKIGDTFEGRINFLTREKETIPFLITSSLIKEGIVFVGQDIKEILRYQEKLKREIEKKIRELEEAKAILEIKVKARKKELEELSQSLKEKIKAKNKELQEKIQELEKFKKFAIGREAKLIELRKEAEKLKKELEEIKKSSRK